MGLYQMTRSWHEMPGPGVRGQDLLAEGKVAAMICPDLPPLVAKKDPRIAQLFPRYWEDEVAYYKQTGIFPIMHSLIIKQEIAERYPWVVTNLIKAFDESKKLALKSSSTRATYRWRFSAPPTISSKSCSGRTLGLMRCPKPIARIFRLSCDT